MVLEFRIVPGGAPLYRQIADQVRWAVTTGAQKPGDALPSVRALAEHLVINPNTVAKAYGDLVHDGVIEGYPGKGYVVARHRQVLSREERTRRLREALETFLGDALFLDFSADEVRRALDQRLSKLPGDGRGKGG